MDVILIKPKKIKIECIPVGECFFYGNCVFIVVHSDKNMSYNTFNVTENHLETVFKDTTVTPLEMQLIQK